MSDESTDRPEAYTEPAGEGPGGPGLIRTEADAHAAEQDAGQTAARAEADTHAHDNDLSERQGRYEAGAGREAAETSAALTRSQAGAGREAAEASAALTRSQAGAGREAAEASAALTRSQADAHQDLTSGALARIASSAEGLIAQVTGLTESFARDKAISRTAWLRFVVATTLGLLTLLIVSVVAVVYLHGQDRRSQVTARELRLISAQQKDSVEQRQRLLDNQKRILDIQKQLASCTDPNGTCKKQGDAQIVAAIMSLNRAGVARLACAQDVGTGLPVAQQIAAITACVNKATAGH